MENVLHTVHRIRKAEERRARVQLAEDQRAVDGCENTIQTLERAMEASYDKRGLSCNVIELVHHHSDALRLEMRRRQQLRELQVRRSKVTESHRRLHTVAIDAKLVEIVADARDLQEHAELTHRDQITMDEQGLQSWWRRSA